MRVKGSALKTRLIYVQERGADSYARYLRELAPGTRAIVEDGLLPNDWYPYECFLNLCETADRVVGKGDLSLCDELGRHGCDVNLTSMYRLLFKVGSVNFILRRAAVAWRTTYDTGEMRVLEQKEGFAHLRLEGWPQPQRAHCLSVRGWMHRAAEISGAKAVKSKDTCRALGDPECEFVLRWQD